MKYYKTGSYGALIKELDIIKETEKCVYIKNEYSEKEERYNKIGTYSNYFKTYLEAKEFLENKKKLEIKSLECQLKSKKIELEEIYKL
jgi:protein subunit release factor A